MFLFKVPNWHLKEWNKVLKSQFATSKPTQILLDGNLQVIALYLGDDDAFIQLIEMKDTLHRLGTSEVHATYRIEGYDLVIIQARDGYVIMSIYNFVGKTKILLISFELTIGKFFIL